MGCLHNGNILSSLPELPKTLKHLSCSVNPLDSLPILNDSLETLICENTSITNLPNLPNSLTHISCYGNSLMKLPTLPNSLHTLNCTYTNLDSLPTLPPSLKRLACDGNSLISLPTIPDSLTHLICSNNLLTTLPTLPSTLQLLECGSNQLSNLPVLSNSLNELVCDKNQLSNIPNLPFNLTKLDCSENLITSLPVLPSSLTTLVCPSNQLSNLPELPDSLYQLVCHDNPDLYCLPKLNKIFILVLPQGNQIECLPNYPTSNVYCSPLLYTFPVCKPNNTNNCSTYVNIIGEAYLDNIHDCNIDSTETPLKNIIVTLFQNGLPKQKVYTTYNGEYSFLTNNSFFQYSIDTSNTPFSISCPDSGYYTSNITVLDSLDTDMNFGLRCKSGHDVGVQSINGRFRPADLSLVEIHAGDMSNFYGANCASGVSGTLSVVMTGEASYIAPAPGALTPSSINGDTPNYSIADFGNINFNTAFNIMVLTDTTATLGSEVCFTVSVTPLLGDNNPTNNTLTQCFTVVGSYDPNDKSVYPSANIDTTVEWLTYTIRFQNTGTDTARHVFITDTLSNALDVASFRLLSYSHQPSVQIKGNALRFNFPYINLVDSPTNEPLSNGYVQYKIKLKPNQPIGTSINNTAFIYFDFNAPIVTNTTTNTIALPTSIASPSREEFKFSLYPNPAKSTVNLFASKEFIGQQVVVVDLMGRVIFETTLNTPNISINTSNLSAGVYIVRLGNSAARFVIEK